MRTYKMKYVMFAFQTDSGRVRYQFQESVDVLELERGASEEQHIPTLIGVDVLQDYTIKPRKRVCYLER